MVKGYAGQSKGELINWMSKKASNQIQNELLKGSKELEQMKNSSESSSKRAVGSIEDLAADAEADFSNASKRMRKAKQLMAIAKQKKLQD